MSLKLMYITNDVDIAKVAQDNGVDWIFIDLEINGKEERQGHLDTVISRHSIDDIKRVKNVLGKAKLLVRVNPINGESKEEIDKVIDNGADIIMLPFFKSKEEVEKFIYYVDGRVKTCLLCETPEAVEKIDDILLVSGIDAIHVGLNDLHLGYKKKFMFELLTDGTVEMLCNKFRDSGIHYGFGGIAQLGKGDLPAENIIAEHYRLGSTMAILSRSFYSVKVNENKKNIHKIFYEGITNIREYETRIENENMEFFKKNQEEVFRTVKEIDKVFIK